MTELPRPSISTEHTARSERAWKLTRDPTFRFFVIGALLFFAHRLIAGDPNVITITPGTRADLERRFRDHKGRAPTHAELTQALDAWKREEALYREALHDDLDRDDPSIRTVLADKVRARAALGVQKREPSDAELERFLAAERARYEMPLRYGYETVVFAKSEESAERKREEYERALNEGKDPSTLGRPVLGGNLPFELLSQKFGAALAKRVVRLAPGQWERFDDAENLLLLRVKGVQGGMPSFAELRPRLVADLLAAEREKAVEQTVREVVGRYRFEETP
jgi:hypothetical protein